MKPKTCFTDMIGIVANDAEYAKEHNSSGPSFPFIEVIEKSAYDELEKRCSLCCSLYSEQIEALTECNKRLVVEYNERAIAMQDTGNIVRSLYQPRIDKLVKALKTLRNEVRGTLHAHELAIRYDSGNSNWQCLELALEKAETALATYEAGLTK